MSNLSTAVMIANEIVKQVDFTYANDQTIANISVALQSILSGGNADYVIGGKVVPYISGGMNFVIEPIFGHCRSTGVDVVDTEASGAISVEAADAILDRLDIVEIRGVVEEFDHQQRRFRDPETGQERMDTIATKKRIKLDVKVKKGSNGSVTAPLADTGYIKIAELILPAGTVSITADNIRNITARADSLESNNWTVEKSRTFNPGYLSEIIVKFLIEHGEDGKHRDNVIKAQNIKFGIEDGDVNGTAIPSGQSMSILGGNYTSQVSITAIIVALANAVNVAYPYANNLLGRYIYTPDFPVAASTGQVDIIAGGEMIIDGIACTVGQMVFLKDQENKKQNGFWEVQTGQWNRYAGYGAENTGCFNQKFVLVKKGTANQGKIFYLDSDSYVVDTDALNFRESMFSPQDLPGKALIRGPDGKSNEDKKREELIQQMDEEMSIFKEQVRIEISDIKLIPLISMSHPFMVASDKRKFLIRKDTIIPVRVNGIIRIFRILADTEYDVTDILDDGVLEGGKDYFVFIVLNANTLGLAVSLEKTLPTGFSTNQVLCRIGGFHTLCVDAGTGLTYVEGGVTKNHPLNGYIAGDILPESVWCLNHRPHSDPEGMVYIPSLDFWCDIYLQSGSGANTRSVYQGAITRTRQYVDFVEDQFCVRKELLDDGEFAAAMLGSNEQTAVLGASESGATSGGAGGRKDTANRRMISIYGVEEGCGSIWQWLRSTSAGGAVGSMYGQTAATPTYGWVSPTTSGYGPYGQAGGKGSFWGLAGALLAAVGGGAVQSGLDSEQGRLQQYAIREKKG